MKTYLESAAILEVCLFFLYTFTHDSPSKLKLASQGLPAKRTLPQGNQSMGQPINMITAMNEIIIPDWNHYLVSLTHTKSKSCNILGKPQVTTVLKAYRL